MNLRQYAKGKPCFIRVPAACSFDPEQTVLCHARIIGISGAGLKVPDLLAAFGCDPCHKIVDGQTPSDYSYEERRLMLLDGVMRTQAYLIARHLVKW